MPSMLRQARRTAIKTIATGTIVVAAIEATTKLPTEGRSSEFYHQLCDKAITPLIRLVLNPETAHNLAIEALKRNLAPNFRPSAIERHSLDSTSTPFQKSGAGSEKGLVFGSCVGLAAGFDKDGVVTKELLDLGFGFVEIGSVTPLPQPGNPKPRMFRLTEDRGVINRYGFNSIGADGVEENLKKFRRIQMEQGSGEKEKPSFDLSTILNFARNTAAQIKDGRAPGTVEPPGVLGVNLGKNKDSTEETADYQAGIRQLGPYADYIVINISSPNTPGLQGLQKHDPIRRLLNATRQERDALPPQSRDSRGVVEGKDLPLLVKISPDLSPEEMEDIAAAVIECGIDGIVVANTSTARSDRLLSKYRNEAGGLSGAPIRDISTECIRNMYRLTEGEVPIIGVGGVGNGHEAYVKLKAGASLVQIYSMMVYEGPGVVSRIRKELAELMLRDGYRRVEDVIGVEHEQIYWKKREARKKRMLAMETLLVDE